MVCISHLHLFLPALLPTLDSNYCFIGTLDQIWKKEASLFPKSRAQKEMNASISVSFRHIKAEYLWTKSMRHTVKFKEDVIAE